MANFLTRPVLVDAARWNGTNVEEIAYVVDPSMVFGDIELLTENSSLFLEWAGSSLEVQPGQWIVRDPSGLLCIYGDTPFHEAFEAVDG